jgi:hypothetical protein
MVLSLEHDIEVTKSHQNLLPTQSVIVVHTVEGFLKEKRTFQMHNIIVMLVLQKTNYRFATFTSIGIFFLRFVKTRRTRRMFKGVSSV